MKSEMNHGMINILKNLAAAKPDAPYAEAINEAVSLLVAQDKRITDLEDKLEKINATGLTPEDIAFFLSPKNAEICKRIRSAAERGSI